MQIRQMTVADLHQVVALEKVLFVTPWSYDDLLYEIQDQPYGYYFVLEDQDILGYAGIWLIDQQCQITTIGVLPTKQGQGLGHLLMDHILEVAKTKSCQNINLEVRVSNEKAIRLYRDYGFQDVAIRKNYYQDNHEDAYLMIKEMEG